MAENDGVQAGAAGGQPQFNIQRTYLKDVSFEAPMGPKAFTIQGLNPKVGLEVNTRANKLSDDIHEVILTLTVTAKHEEEVLYLIELQQAGVFTVQGFPEDQLRAVMSTVCPNFLFPYAREAIDNLVLKGSFAPLNLSPIDFDAMYRNAEAQRQAAAGAAPGADGAPTLN